MTLRRRVIRALDRPGGRALLGAVTGRLAQTGAPGVRVYFRRGMWVHRQREIVFVDGPVLDYHPPIFHTWDNELDRRMADAEDYWFQLYRPRPGDVIIDAGAGRGEDTIAFSKAVGPAGRVIAIEAHPVTFGCLCLFCELNRLTNVTPVHAALVDRAGPVAIESAEGWQTNRVAAPEAGGAARVPGLTLDELAERLNVSHIDFLKMNIEGAEGLAVRGMEKTLRVTGGLCISCHDFRANAGQGEFLRTKEFVAEAVRGAGFTTVSRDADPRPYIADQVNAFRSS
ncbi:MAG TPA: FkbM family methyltransferase [Bryobacteraceae bacterium]|nr:FkbM family methyltransferase [Bryobacteraceae bacterium]